MKHRKRKRKPKQQPAVQVMVQGETVVPGRPVEMQVEIESVAIPVENRAQADDPTSPLASSADAETAASDPVAPTATDRRAHRRYAFTAAIEIAVAKPNERIKRRVRDLSQQGCYVDTDRPFALGRAADVCITKGTKSFAARARVVFNQPGKGMGLMFTDVEPGQFGTLNTWIAESREASWLADNRRRSQRVLMRIPVRVTGQAGAALLFEEETHTLSISSHGALIVVRAAVYRGQQFTLSNVQTKASLECVVVHVDKFLDEQTQVGVEFMLPNPTFWRVAFPPKDWTSRHPDAKC
jgi:PilZ domain